MTTTATTTDAASALILDAAAGQKMTIVYDSKAKSFMNKGRGDNANPYYDHVVKRTTARGRWAGSKTYTTGVNSARIAEGNDDAFIAQDHRFADHVDGSALLSHRTSGELYVGFTMKESDSTEYTTHEYIDTRTGNVVPASDLAPWLKAKSSSKPASQELDDNVVHFRNPAMSGVREFTTGGTRYEVSNPASMTLAKLRARLAQTASN